LPNTTLEQLYRQHRQGLFSVALTVTGHTDRAEDAVHNAFVKLWVTEAFVPDNPNAAAYVYQAVRNAAIDICRKAGRQPLRSLGECDSIFDTGSGLTGNIGSSSGQAAAHQPIAALLESERSNLVRQALEGLPAAKREVVVMKLYGQLTFEQIALSLGEPRDTVASRYRRALEEIKRALETLV
jgi:RNA polymerase sigma-70 factor (ECF subfamily)